MNVNFNRDSMAKSKTSHYKVEKSVVSYFIISLMVSTCISLFLSIREKSDLVISFIFYGLYSFPTIFVLGGGFSFLIEYKLGTQILFKRKMLFKYLYKLFLYIIAGFVVMNIFWIIITLDIPRITTVKEFLSTYDIGIFGSVLYYHFILLFQLIIIGKNRLSR